jgi:hypothetical protein
MSTTIPANLLYLVVLWAEMRSCFMLEISHSKLEFNFTAEHIKMDPETQ